jgi:biotin carboxyl carrier protein
MYQVTINEKQTTKVEKQGKEFVLNGENFSWDIAPLGNNRFHILQDSKSYNAEVLEADYAEKSFKIRVNGAVYDAQAKDRFDLLLENMGMNTSAKNKVNNIKAPMPGLIWEIKTQVGDAVKAGDVVLVLVAMKMENALKSQGDGVVKAIKIAKGDTVDKGQILIEFE